MMKTLYIIVEVYFGRYRKVNGIVSYMHAFSIWTGIWPNNIRKKKRRGLVPSFYRENSGRHFIGNTVEKSVFVTVIKGTKVIA